MSLSDIVRVLDLIYCNPTEDLEMREASRDVWKAVTSLHVFATDWLA